ncbi:hypothetical protein NEIELOOT_01378 [Neisseria elongata subsp. glycolytica ATCC 29315]|uniref:Uncharacterized protein n=1 Tax=Neisseria elongata subsp. glycolytica ATCC 29315 TaxID=546263 RepID=D4DQN8_NEIEG|nr:hypothetical protein NEIELOOT_01378 [Neisseria elongata subsp. glycolytica ATCC 29315]
MPKAVFRRPPFKRACFATIKSIVGKQKTAVDNRQPFCFICSNGLEPCFDGGSRTGNTADQANRTCGSTHCTIDLITFVGAFLAFQCQFFGNVLTLASVLFQFGTGQLGRSTVTAGFDGSRIITYSQIADRASLSGTAGYND